MQEAEQVLRARQQARRKRRASEKVAEELRPIVDKYLREQGIDKQGQAAQRLAEAALMFLRKRENGDGELFLKNKDHRPPVKLLGQVWKAAKQKTSRLRLGKDMSERVVQKVFAPELRSTYYDFLRS